MMNWSLIILGLVAVACADNSYLVVVPKLVKIGSDNEVSVFIGDVSEPVEVKFELTIGRSRIEGKTTCQPGETRNATLTLPSSWAVGAGELRIVGTGGVRFEEKRDVLICDDRHVILVQTSSSIYRPGDVLEVRVVATDENLIPIESGEITIKIYDATLNLVSEYPRFPIRSGLTETIRWPVSEHVNMGTWLISATIENTTSSVEILVACPLTPSFDLKAIFQRFLLRTDKTLRGFIEITDDNDKPIFGRATIAVRQLTEQEEMITKPERSEEHQNWKSQTTEIAGRVELNYDLQSVFNIDLTKALAVETSIEVIDLASGQQRVVRHLIPVLSSEVIYDIHPLRFEAGVKNEFEIIAKRPDGKPTKMEDLIVTLRLLFAGEKQDKLIEIKDFDTRVRNDIGLFKINIPKDCMGVLVTLTPLGADGKQRGYRTRAVPLVPMPPRRHNDAKLTIKLAPVRKNVDSQIATVGQTAKFNIELVPSKSVEKLEPLAMSYVLLTNGQITLAGELTVRPTSACRTQTSRAIQPSTSVCVFNGTLSIPVTRSMLPYSTLLVYSFQPSFGFNVAESYRFSVAGLFQSTLTLNATVVPFTAQGSMDDNLNSQMRESSEDTIKWAPVSSKAQEKTRLELSFTAAPESIVGLNVVEFDAVLQGIPNDLTKERLLHYLTRYEQLPISGTPTLNLAKSVLVRREHQTWDERSLNDFEDDEQTNQGIRDLDGLDEDEQHEHEPRGKGKSPGIKTSFKVGSDDDDASAKVKFTVPGQKQQSKKRPRSLERLEDDDEQQEERELNENEQFSREENEEKQQCHRQRHDHKVRYPLKKMIFGIESSRPLPPVEGDDVYAIPTRNRFYDNDRSQYSSSHSRRKSIKSVGQYDVTVGNNEYVIATSSPRLWMDDVSMPGDVQEQHFDHEEQYGNDEKHSNQEEQRDSKPSDRCPHARFGTPSWYEKKNSKLNLVSKEAWMFLHSGLSIVSDFDSLRIPADLQRVNLTSIWNKLRSRLTSGDRDSFDILDDTRQLLQESLTDVDGSMFPPTMKIEEHVRNTYYRSIFFNTSRVDAQGTGKVLVPRTKPYSTWLATGFSLHPKSGLAIAQPIRLPTNPGLFILANFPQQVQIGEYALLTCGINNYLGKDLSNVVVRIRTSPDYDLVEETQPERVISTSDKDYTWTISTLKSFGVETRNIVLVPKRAGVIKILLEVESEFGGDYELLTSYVRESGIKRRVFSNRLYDLTGEKKTFGPFTKKITQSPFLRSVKFAVSGTGLDRFLEHYTMETNSFVGIDRALVRLYRSLGFRRYLNLTSQSESHWFNMTSVNISTAYQKLQLYADYNGSYSFTADEGTQSSSLYLTSLAFGAMISPLMPFRDNVTLNRTLNYILSRQQPDGSFADNGPCLHKRFCSGKYRREAMTALVLYSLTRDNASLFMPEFVHRRLFNGEQSPIQRAQQFLESRMSDIKPCLVTSVLVEMALLKCNCLSEEFEQRLRQTVLKRQLTVMLEDGSKYVKLSDNKFSFDDRILINTMTLIVYAHFGDFKTTSALARYIVNQSQAHPHIDTIFDAIFQTEAWLDTDCLFRKRFRSEKFSVIVDVTTDNGQKKQFKIDQQNIDITQRWTFKLPVQTVTYSVSGFGLVDVCLKQVFVEKEQTSISKLNLFQLTQKFTTLPWLNEIKAKTCVIPQRHHQMENTNSNNTFVVQVQLPSGMRVNLRQIGFFVDKTREVMYFTYSHRWNKLNFFLNVPWTDSGKQICFDWCLERLSQIVNHAPIEVRVYDYAQPEIALSRLFPVQVQPALLGYSFIDAVHKARPNLATLTIIQQLLHA